MENNVIENKTENRQRANGRRRASAPRSGYALEKDVVKAIKNYLKTVPHCFFWKEHGGMYSTSGVPDIIACIGGRFYGFEVKTDTGRPTKLQLATIRKIQRAGGIAGIARSVEDVRKLIESGSNTVVENDTVVESDTVGGE